MFGPMEPCTFLNVFCVVVVVIRYLAHRRGRASETEKFKVKGWVSFTLIRFGFAMYNTIINNLWRNRNRNKTETHTRSVTSRTANLKNRIFYNFDRCCCCYRIRIRVSRRFRISLKLEMIQHNRSSQ